MALRLCRNWCRFNGAVFHRLLVSKSDLSNILLCRSHADLPLPGVRSFTDCEGSHFGCVEIGLSLNRNTAMTYGL